MIQRSLVLIAVLGCFGCSEPIAVKPPPPTPPEFSPPDLIQLLEKSYREQNTELFNSLLANDLGNRAEFRFILDPESNAADPTWPYVEMARIHQRMFEPQNTLANQSPVPLERWLVSVTIDLTPNTKFTERTDLYESAQNPTGLDPARWKATDAIYATDVLFDLYGANDIQVTSRANFVIIEDLTKELGDDGKFLLLQWNDLANKSMTPTRPTSWSQVLSLYK